MNDFKTVKNTQCFDIIWFKFKTDADHISLSLSLPFHITLLALEVTLDITFTQPNSIMNNSSHRYVLYRLDIMWHSRNTSLFIGKQKQMMTVQLRFYNRSKTEPYANTVCENKNKKVGKKVQY